MPGSEKSKKGKKGSTDNRPKSTAEGTQDSKKRPRDSSTEPEKFVFPAKEVRSYLLVKCDPSKLLDSALRSEIPDLGKLQNFFAGWGGGLFRFTSKEELDAFVQKRNETSVFGVEMKWCVPTNTPAQSLLAKLYFNGTSVLGELCKQYLAFTEKPYVADGREGIQIVTNLAEAVRVLGKPAVEIFGQSVTCEERPAPEVNTDKGKKRRKQN
eukprot:NODE_1731_length_777_cov_177.884615_g1346_i0.p1 GENE.NODE_1731_length_777_cov_177.884615_g1346_i0~~NODE_1731_length_777_cov_177.884615_g1346_i0.p1  ORF type:complete len:211 (+),score=36.46 NODE_1731_length_777_cov_177.884615_g1346_i0:67-699(+)